MTYYKKYITERADDLRQGRLGRKLNNTTVTPRPFEHYWGQVREGETTRTRQQFSPGHHLF